MCVHTTGAQNNSELLIIFFLILRTIIIA